MSFSVLNNSGFIFSSFVEFFILWKPCSFKVKPTFNACCLIAVLNSLEPVKYNMAKGYSSGGEYRKSIRRGIASCISNLPIVKLFNSPCDNISNNIFFDCNFSMNFSSIIFLPFVEVNIKSTSPESGLLRL